MVRGESRHHSRLGCLPSRRTSLGASSCDKTREGLALSREARGVPTHAVRGRGRGWPRTGSPVSGSARRLATAGSSASTRESLGLDSGGVSRPTERSVTRFPKTKSLGFLRPTEGSWHVRGWHIAPPPVVESFGLLRERMADGVLSSSSTSRGRREVAVKGAEDTLMVATHDRLLRIHTATRKVDVLIEKAFWGGLYPASLVVEPSGAIDIGMRHGVARVEKVGADRTRVRWLLPNAEFDQVQAVGK